MQSKKWYQSKTIWTQIVSVLVATLSAIDTQFGTGLLSTQVAAIIISVLQILGVYGRVSATTEIK